MALNDRERADGRDVQGGQAQLVLLVVFLGGLILIAAADRVLHIGPTGGNLSFAALALLAPVAAGVALADPGAEPAG
jgi:hypothetical protein